MDQGKGCASLQDAGHKALPPSSDLAEPLAHGVPGDALRGKGARDPDPACHLCLGHVEGLTLLERMEKLLSKHEAESFAVLVFECCSARG